MYEELDGAAARLVGAGDRAVITVDPRAPRSRQRFSAAHELGHWVHDRGEVAIACASDQLITEWGAANPERRANRFAADLLLPRTIFKRHARHLPITFTTARELAQEFATSLTATTIRLVELGSYPAVLACHDQNGKCRWTVRNLHDPASMSLCTLTVEHHRMFGGLTLSLSWWT